MNKLEMVKSELEEKNEILLKLSSMYGTLTFDFT